MYNDQYFSLKFKRLVKIIIRFEEIAKNSMIQNLLPIMSSEIECYWFMVTFVAKRLKIVFRACMIIFLIKLRMSFTFPP